MKKQTGPKFKINHSKKELIKIIEKIDRDPRLYETKNNSPKPGTNTNRS